MSNGMEKGTTHAVIGYVPDAVAKSLTTQGYGKALEVRVERGNDREVVRVPADAIAGVLHGASQGGETGVQVLLKPGASVESVARGAASDLLQAIADPGLVFRRPPINVIYIDPLRIPRLTAELEKKS